MRTVHDPVFDVPQRPYYRWGAGPFHMRGAIYRDSIARTSGQLAKRGLRTADVLKTSGDAALESFMSQTFAPGGWYDIGPAVHVAPLFAKACGVSLLQHMRESALMYADDAVRGFTGVILKIVSNETVASWLPRMSTWFHDFGAIETRVVGPQHVRGVRRGLPVFVVQGWSILGMEFTERVLQHAGAREPRAHTLEAEEDGMHGECPLYRVSFEVKWGG